MWASLILGFCVAPDRSGEAMLTQLFVRYGKVGAVSATVSKSARDHREDALIPTNDVLISFERRGGRLRIESSDVWDNAWLMVSDGRTVRRDSGYETVLTDQAKNVWSDSNLDRGGRGFSVFSYFLQGPECMKKLVGPDSDIVKLSDREIRIASRDLGTMRLTLDANSNLTQIEYDNLAGRRDAYLLFPTWNERPSEPLEREAITADLRPRFGRKTFDTSIRRGEAVEDRRKKPSR